MGVRMVFLADGGGAKTGIGHGVVDGVHRADLESSDEQREPWWPLLCAQCEGVRLCVHECSRCILCVFSECLKPTAMRAYLPCTGATLRYSLVIITLNV